MRKQKDTKLLKATNGIIKRELLEVISKIDLYFMKKVVRRKYVYDYVMKYGPNKVLKKLLQSYR